jgi:hypothetical protein
MNSENLEMNIVGRRWTHSHEEDSQEGMVFRPSGFVFPPSRGREGFELRPDHSFVDIAVAPMDGTIEQEGTWAIVDDPCLAIRLRHGQGPHRFLRVIRADTDRLILQP